MPANLVQTADGATSFDTNYPGSASNAVGFIPVSFTYNASSVDAYAFVSDRSYVVKSVILRVNAAGTDGSAVNVMPRKVPSGTALASGTALLSAAIDLKSTASTNVTGALSTTASDLKLAPGDAIGIDFIGTLTAATGVITVMLAVA